MDARSSPTVLFHRSIGSPLSLLWPLILSLLILLLIVVFLTGMAPNEESVPILPTVIITLDASEPFSNTPYTKELLEETFHPTVLGTRDAIQGYEWAEISTIIVHSDAIGALVSPAWLRERYDQGIGIAVFGRNMEYLVSLLGTAPISGELKSQEHTLADFVSEWRPLSTEVYPVSFVAEGFGCGVSTQDALYDSEYGWMSAGSLYLIAFNNCYGGGLDLGGDWVD